MCGRYVAATPIEELAGYFAARPDEDLEEVARPRYNVPPTEQVLGVVGDAPGADRRIRAYRWGLVPPWAKSLSVGNRAFNARAESAATKPAFRSAFRERRILVPASAFYEWRRAGGRRQPYAFRRADGDPLAFAGLWERWRDPGSGLWLRSLAIITTDAGPDAAFVHDRQPVVVEPAQFGTWLECGPDGADADALQGVLVPSPAGTLAAHPVDLAVGNAANDSPRLLDPVELREDADAAELGASRGASRGAHGDGAHGGRAADRDRTGSGRSAGCPTAEQLAFGDAATD